MDKSFTKGLRLLEILAVSERARGVTDLAAELELNKSNVHRLLMTLQMQGFVRQSPVRGTYELTTRMWELGNHSMRRMDLVDLARPAMTKLAMVTEETIHLSILDDVEVLYIDKIESQQHVRAHTSVGGRAPAYAVATGKAMLSHLPDSYLDRFGDGLIPYTATTRATVEALREDISLARAQGYAAVLHGEWREGIAACACAVIGRSGALVGAIGMSGPDSRIKRKQIKQFSVDVMAAAQSVSKIFGFVPPP